METVLERVQRVVKDRLCPDTGQTVALETSFVEDLQADSLGLVELIMGFEEEFSTEDNPVAISDDEAGNIKTVQDAILYLNAHGIANE